jgi:hypothetical protein
VRGFAAALEKRDVVLAEVGIWRNVLSRDVPRGPPPSSTPSADSPPPRNSARVRGEHRRSWSEEFWDGHHPKHYSADFFDAAVEAARKVIDAVNPKRTKMTFEIMPCQFIDSARVPAVPEGRGSPWAPASTWTRRTASPVPRLYTNAAFFQHDSPFGRRHPVHPSQGFHLNPREFTVRLEETVIGKGDIDY